MGWDVGEGRGILEGFGGRCCDLWGRCEKSGGKGEGEGV